MIWGFAAAKVLFQLLHDEAGAQFWTIHFGLSQEEDKIDGGTIDPIVRSYPAELDQDLICDLLAGHLGTKEAEVSVQGWTRESW
ncbi:MAG TPA: hypothetical protein VNH82_03380 [Candidatus Dormibacteraeota bacterium]|nr:hypothetical protein [Candidatus Dormibacteraeota bacterium]